MAKTYYATTDPEAKMIWDEKLYQDTLIDSYFGRFMGTGPDSIVQVKSDLTKQQGDRIRCTLMNRLSGDGVTSGVQLEGNEERITDSTMDVVLEEYAHAVRDRGPLDRQRVFFSISNESQRALKGWGSEKIERLHFNAAFSSPTKILYGGGVANDASIVGTGQAIDTTILSRMKAGAMTGFNRTQTPIRPVRVDGQDFYVAVVHPDVMYDLFRDTTFIAARQYAEVRGKDNPIFTGAKAIWNGIVIHEHELCPIAKTYGAGTVPGAKGLFMGAQALVWAEGRRPEVVQETFDYKREEGYAWSLIAKAQKSVFNSKDYGIIEFHTYRTSISDA